MNVSQLPERELISGCRILVVGDIMLDRYWFGDVSRISPEAPVPVVHIQHVENRLGGAANVALNLKTLGAHVTLLSIIGQDHAAHTLRSLLSNHGIEAELGEDARMETTVKLRVIGRNQQMIRIDFEKAYDHEALAGVLESFKATLAEHDVVIFSDYGKGVLAPISRMIELSHLAGKPVLIDPKGSDWSRYRGASVITPNLAELAQVVGSWTSEPELQDKAETLRQKLGLQALLVTRSEEGMTLFDSDGVHAVPALVHEVVDVSGAGDTVIATMALMTACGIGLPQSMVWANRAGGLVVAKFGAASLSYDELHG